MRVTAPSAWPWLDHSVSGLIRRTERPVQTRFRCAYTYRLKLARQIKSLTHYTKGTLSPLRAPTVCRQSVSGSLSLPSSGCFSPFPHGTCSLSVMREYLGLEGGPPTFRQDFTCPALLKGNCSHYPYGAVTHYGRPFQARSGCLTIATGLVRVRSPLLAESLLMSFPPGTEMFQFPGFASNPYVFRIRYLHRSQLSKARAVSRSDIRQPTSKVGFPIRISADQSLFATPRGFSQRTTSFIACACQGIHRTPLRHLIALIINTRPVSESLAPVRGPEAGCHTFFIHTANYGGVKQKDQCQHEVCP